MASLELPESVSALQATPASVMRHFDLFQYPYSSEVCESIQARRDSYPERKLMIDRLLELAGIDSTLYPPENPVAIRHLLDAIYTSEIDGLKQDCFAYYVLLDYDFDNTSASSDQDGSYTNGEASMTDEAAANSVAGPSCGTLKTSRADDFARAQCLPKVWRYFMKGYWAVDHGLWEDALANLSDPSISSLNFVPALLQIFASHVSPPSKALSLIHNFILAISPDLTTLSAPLIQLRAISLAHGSSLWDCFSFIRSRPVEEQRKLREGVWSWALGAPQIPVGALPNGHGADGRSRGNMGIQKSILQQLLHLPLIPEETDHLSFFLAHPPRAPLPSIGAKELDVLHDLVALRMIHQGQYAQSIALDKALSGREAIGQADRRGANGAGSGGESRQQRRDLIRDFIDVLPEVQRRVLSMMPEQSIGASQEGELPEVNGHMEVDSAANTISFAPQHSVPIVNGHGVAHYPIPATSRASAYADLSASSVRPTPPRVQAVSNATARSASVTSPFAGPPQFHIASPSIASPSAPAASASGPATPQRGASGASLINTSTQRLPSGSPFALPPGTKVEVPRPSAKNRHVSIALPSGTRSRHLSEEGRSRVTSQGSAHRRRESDVSVDAQDARDVEMDGDEDTEMNDKENDVNEHDEAWELSETEKSKSSSSRKKALETSESARSDMPPPPVPAPRSSVRRSTRRAASVVSSTADHEEAQDVSPTPTPAKNTGGVRRSATRAQLDKEAESLPAAKKLKGSKSTMNLSSTSRSRSSRQAENLSAEVRPRTRSPPSTRKTQDRGSSRSKETVNGGESGDVVGDLPTVKSAIKTGNVRRSTRRAASVASSVEEEEDAERKREVSPAMSTVSTGSTRSRAAREGSETPRAKKR